MEIEKEKKVKDIFYDFSPLNDLMRIILPSELSRMLREVHHGFMSTLLADFIESDTKQSSKEIQYSNNTLESLYFTKELADILDKIDKGNVEN